jgi:hypothetical protein
VKNVSVLVRRFQWLNFPGAVLVALLQRTPVLRIAGAAENVVTGSPVAALLRSAFATVASLGALNSLAGATQFQVSKNPTTGTVGTAITPVSFGVTGAPTPAGSYRMTGQLPSGLALVGANSNGVVNGLTGTIAGTPTVAGNFSVSIRAYEFSDAQGDAFGPITLTFNISAGADAPPTITSQPGSLTANIGSQATLSVAASGSPAPSYQWRRNGVDIGGATGPTLTIDNAQPANAGVYTVVVSNSQGTVVSSNAILGLNTAERVVGGGSVVGTDIRHPNGNIFDQVLLNGAVATVHAAPGKVLRVSYLDLNDDIVQVEFAGSGAATIALDNASGPAAPVKYNQSTVAYMKGHASIVIGGADETTNVSVFTVGRATAFDPTGGYNILVAPGPTNDPANNGSPLFVGHPASEFDGVADIAVIAIASGNGNFGGIRTANASYWHTRGVVGVFAPGVQFLGPVNAENIGARDASAPVFMIASASGGTRITGGDLNQENGAAVQVAGLSQLVFAPGSTSQGVSLPAQANKAVLLQDGVDVTGTVVVNPAP